VAVCSRANIVHVQLTVDDDSLLLEVSDPSTTWPREVAAGPEDEDGRGLLLARELAQEFGAVARDHIGKTVYARFILRAG
jgi:two-component sensor histidine kinase